MANTPEPMMRSSRLVSLNRIILTGSVAVIVLSTLLLTNFVLWSIATSSFDQGYQAAKIGFEKDLGLPKLSFSHDRRIYQDLSEDYANLALLAAGCLGIGFLRLFERMREVGEVLSSLILICLVAIIRLLWYYQIGLKDLNDSFANAPYRVLIAPSLTFDWICLIITVALIFIEAMLLLVWEKQKRMLKD